MDEMSREAVDATTPRPWRAVTEGSYDQKHAAAKAFEAVMAVRVPDCDGCEFTDLTWIRDDTDAVEVALVGNGPKSTDNAALIVAAVNNFDRLRRIEAAARALVEDPIHIGDKDWTVRQDAARTALRAALEGASS